MYFWVVSRKAVSKRLTRFRCWAVSLVSVMGLWLLLAYGDPFLCHIINVCAGDKARITLQESAVTAVVFSTESSQPTFTTRFRQNASLVTSQDDIPDELMQLYLKRLNSLHVKREHLRNTSCPNDWQHEGSPCRDANCTAKFLQPEQRLRKIIQSQYPVTQEHWRLISSLANHTRPRVNLIFVTAASANHYDEIQGLLMSLYADVFPFLKNYTQLTYKLVYYDLGLSTQQLAQLQSRTSATFEVIRFPFESMPTSIKKPITYTWKPLTIKAQLNHSDVTFWMDASTRFKTPNITVILNDVNTLGLVITRTSWKLPLHVAQPMLDYFHVQPCLVSPFYELASGFIAFKNEQLILRAVVDPWVSCAFSPDCLCPGKNCRNLYGCNKRNASYSWCHRYDQSAIALILTSLFDWRSTQLIVGNQIEFKRGQKVSYLPHT